MGLLLLLILLGTCDSGDPEPLFCEGDDCADVASGTGGAAGAGGSTGDGGTGGSGPASTSTSSDASTGGGEGGAPAGTGGEGGMGGDPSDGGAGPVSSSAASSTVATSSSSSGGAPPCISDLECSSRACVDGECLPVACIDGVRNGAETGVDCGGACPACGPCPDLGHLVISEVQTRGDDGARDEFVEVYNPMPRPVSRSLELSNKWGNMMSLGAVTLPAFGRIVVAGSAFPGPAAYRFQGGADIEEHDFVHLTSNDATLDAVCFCTGGGCTGAVPGICEGGTRAENPSSHLRDWSMVREPYGAECIDTNNNAADFRPREFPSPGS